LLAQEIERDVIEGDFHHGRGSVVQILARRSPASATTLSKQSNI